MTFNEYCNKYFQSVSPMQRDYIDTVDNVISKMNKVRYFNYKCSLRGMGLTTIQAAHAAWILHENSLAMVLYVGQIREMCRQFTNNVVNSFHAQAPRLVTITQQQIYASHNMPRGIKFDFVFSDCDFPQSLIRTLTK